MRAFLLLLALLTAPALGQVPAAAQIYRADVVRSAYRTFGPGAPVATLAAQIHQESAWNPQARSWVGAQGLTQFMPGTAAALAKQYPGECAPANPLVPAWAIRCRDHLMRDLIAASARAVGAGPVSICSAWVFAFRSYNGGPGWTLRDRRAALAAGADPDDWRSVRPFNAGRNAAAIRENREYPERIFHAEPRYLSWGPGLGCLDWKD